jgi:hypothetical protein
LSECVDQRLAGPGNKEGPDDAGPSAGCQQLSDYEASAESENSENEVEDPAYTSADEASGRLALAPSATVGPADPYAAEHDCQDDLREANQSPPAEHDACDAKHQARDS